MLQIIRLNKSIEYFKKIPLFSIFVPLSVSEVPIIEKTKFLGEIKDNINGLDYIEHMYYINSRISELKKYIVDIKIREYFENYS